MESKLIAEKAQELWLSTQGSYIDISSLWEDDWFETWQDIVEVVLQAHKELK